MSSGTQTAVKRVRGVERIARVAPDRPRGVKAPERLPDGSWSIAAAAQRYQVSLNVVRGWITRGLVVARRQAFPKNPSMQWLTIDEQTDQRLKAVASRPTRAYPKS